MSNKKISPQRKLKLKTHKYKTDSVIKKLFIQKPTSPSEASDESAINFSKKIGGQLNQFYKVQKNIKISNKHIFSIVLDKGNNPDDSSDKFVEKRVIDVKDSFYLTPSSVSVGFNSKGSTNPIGQPDGYNPIVCNKEQTFSWFHDIDREGLTKSNFFRIEYLKIDEKVFIEKGRVTQGSKKGLQSPALEDPLLSSLMYTLEDNNPFGTITMSYNLSQSDYLDWEGNIIHLNTGILTIQVYGPYFLDYDPSSGSFVPTSTGTVSVSIAFSSEPYDSFMSGTMTEEVVLTSNNNIVPVYNFCLQRKPIG